MILQYMYFRLNIQKFYFRSKYKVNIMYHALNQSIYFHFSCSARRRNTHGQQLAVSQYISIVIISQPGVRSGLVVLNTQYQYFKQACAIWMRKNIVISNIIIKSNEPCLKVLKTKMKSIPVTKLYLCITNGVIIDI